MEAVLAILGGIVFIWFLGTRAGKGLTDLVQAAMLLGLLAAGIYALVLWLT
jgi:hypothetical protein